MNLFGISIGICLVFSSLHQNSLCELRRAERWPGLTVKYDKNFKPILTDSKSEMDNILIQLLNGFKANMTQGFPNLGIPILDPLKVEIIHVNMSEEMLSLNGTIKKLEVVELSQFNIVNVSSVFPRISVNIEVTIPSLQISGEYNLEGNAGKVLPIFGKGFFKINLTEINLIVGCQVLNKPNGGFYLKSFSYDIRLQKIEANIGGLLGGGELGDTLNEIINKHALRLFNLFEPRIHGKAVLAVLEFVNKKLEGVKLADILGGSSFASNTNNPIGLPAILQKPSWFPITKADASEYVDYALAHLREHMILNGLDRIPLANKTAEFSESFLGIVWYGEAALYNGLLNGLETIHRAGPANLNMEGEDIVFDAELEINDARLKYDMLAQFMGFGPSATVIGDLLNIKVYVKCRVPAGLNNVTLEEFDVLDLGQLSIDVYGLGPLGFIVGIVADVVGNAVKDVVADMLEGTIKNILNEIVQDLLFPIDQSLGRFATANIRPYHYTFPRIAN